MKVLIVGYGSMGRRRIRIISGLIPTAEIVCVDTDPKRQEMASEAGLTCYGSLSDAAAKHPDVAFVCTSPGHHVDIMTGLIRAGIHVFTELNLTSDRYEEIMSCAKEHNVLVFMSNTLLYKRQIEIIDGLVKGQTKKLTYICHVGQYLPDWHPWESYKDFFAGYKETNGVRELLAIQLPWIVNTFGKVVSLHTEKMTATNLDIDFPDTITTILRHENGNTGVLVVDVVSRKAVTKVEVFGEDLHIFWDGHKDDLYKLNLETKETEQMKSYAEDEHIEGYSDNITEQPYREEVKDFLSAIKGESIPRYSLEQDKYILSLADQIEGIHGGMF